MSWLNPAGGIFYHYRAFRYRDRLWQDFLKNTNEWLMNWKTNTESLVLVGPSAGYVLPDHFLNRFKTIYGIEPDPLARRWFEKYHEKKVIWSTHLEQIDIAHFPEERSVLFCNIIGQLDLISKKDRLKTVKIKKSIQDLIQFSNWASFHDRLSGNISPIHRSTLHVSKRASNEQLLGFYYGKDRAGTLQDHSAEEWLPESDTDYDYWSWEITPGYFHLIEAVISLQK